MLANYDYEEIENILISFIKTYVTNAHLRKVVLGLSGGIDSATAAILCQKALGKKNVHCLFLPEKTTPTIDRQHVQLLCSTFSLPCQKIDITDSVQSLVSDLEIKPDKFCLANIKARIRMVYLYTYANMNKSLVCGTSNKSELLIGYSTKYGDNAVDIQPLGDLYKTQVFEFACHLKIPQEIIDKPPTAGLWLNQTDEEEIGCSYQILDEILFGLERKNPLQQIAREASVSLDRVKQIQQMRKQSEHKRRTPLIPKLGIRTPGFDWRSPIQEG